jgi:hypothetical protein
MNLGACGLAEGLFMGGIRYFPKYSLVERDIRASLSRILFHIFFLALASPLSIISVTMKP